MHSTHSLRPDDAKRQSMCVHTTTRVIRNIPIDEAGARRFFSFDLAYENESKARPNPPPVSAGGDAPSKIACLDSAQSAYRPGLSSNKHDRHQRLETGAALE